jgi:hypothetical protein
MKIETNDLSLTTAERESAERIAARLNATAMSLFRTSDGLRAFVIDAGGGEHTGVQVGTYSSQSARDAEESGYGDRSYWDYLEQAAWDNRDYWLRHGEIAKAAQMLTRSLSESLMGNEGV